MLLQFLLMWGGHALNSHKSFDLFAVGGEPPLAGSQQVRSSVGLPPSSAPRRRRHPVTQRKIGLHEFECYTAVLKTCWQRLAGKTLATCTKCATKHITAGWHRKFRPCKKLSTASNATKHAATRMHRSMQSLCTRAQQQTADEFIHLNHQDTLGVGQHPVFKGVIDSRFQPQGGFKNQYGEMGACVLDKAQAMMRAAVVAGECTSFSQSSGEAHAHGSVVLPFAENCSMGLRAVKAMELVASMRACCDGFAVMPREAPLAWKHGGVHVPPRPKSPAPHASDAYPTSVCQEVVTPLFTELQAFEAAYGTCFRHPASCRIYRREFRQCNPDQLGYYTAAVQEASTRQTGLACVAIMAQRAKQRRRDLVSWAPMRAQGPLGAPGVSTHDSVAGPLLQDMIRRYRLVVAAAKHLYEREQAAGGHPTAAAHRFMQVCGTGPTGLESADGLTSDYKCFAAMLTQITIDMGPTPAPTPDQLMADMDSEPTTVSSAWNASEMAKPPEEPKVKKFLFRTNTSGLAPMTRPTTPAHLFKRLHTPDSTTHPQPQLRGGYHYDSAIPLEEPYEKGDDDKADTTTAVTTAAPTPAPTEDAHEADDLASAMAAVMGGGGGA